ncbi:MAG: UDP-2,3-diacylglucosamine diphosphatase [Candidatus Edwardsbacteria bacterium]
MKPIIYFISDAHFGAEGHEKEIRKVKTFLSFSNLVREKAEELFILGDLFDFWFEYKRVIPTNYFRVTKAIYEMKEAGIKITYIAGNHEWLGSFWNEMGIVTSRNAYEIERQNLRLFLSHGDDFQKGNLGNKILQWFLHLPLNISLYRLIHPDLGIPLAHLFSRFSRRPLPLSLPTGGREGGGSCPLWPGVQEKFKEGFNGVILGHTHKPKFESWQDKTYLNVGDWMEHFTYGKLENGRLTLERWS